MKRHVVLVGLSGSGKSSAGKLVARRLGNKCVDIDGLIESGSGKTIAGMFEEDGEPAFRAVERATVTRVLGGAPTVIVPGGGWAAQPGNLASVPENVFIIYLKTSPSIASSRLASETDRPLLGPMPEADLTNQLRAREQHYMEADAIVETDGLTLAEVVDELVALARKSAGW